MGFYGRMKFNADGSIDGLLKPMYGKQHQGDMGYKIVAPVTLRSAPLMYPIRDERPTCGQVRTVYKASGCCGNPNLKINMSGEGRRLQAQRTGSKDSNSLLSSIRAELEEAKKEGAQHATTLKENIGTLLKEY